MVAYPVAVRLLVGADLLRSYAHLAGDGGLGFAAAFACPDHGKPEQRALAGNHGACLGSSLVKCSPGLKYLRHGVVHTSTIARQPQRTKALMPVMIAPL